MAGFFTFYTLIFTIFHIFLCGLFYAKFANGAPSQDCKTTFTFGYGYHEFFHIADRNETHSPKGLLFKFYVQTRSDAHILLSPKPSPTEKDAVYEIVIGAGKNTFSDIRRLQRDDTKSSISTPNLLSPVESRGFWIHITNKGLIQIGQEDSDMPFMFWQDPEPLYVKYYSFCTWPGVIGKWTFDCSHNKTNGDDDSKELGQPLTTRERLWADMFTDYDPYELPGYEQQYPIDVRAHIRCWSLDLNTKTSGLTISGFATVEWVDEKLSWSPEDYGGIKELNVGAFQMWRPEIVLYNAIEYKSRPFNNGGSIVQSDGRVYWFPIMDLQTKCELDFKNWPRDTHICEINIGVWSHRVYFDIDQVEWPQESSEWRVTSVTIEGITIESVHSVVAFDHNVTSRAVQITVELERNRSIFHNTYFILLIISSVLLVMPFFMTPVSSRKVLFSCCSLIFLCLFAMMAQMTIPETSKRTPIIVIAYTIALAASFVCSIASVILMILVRVPHECLPPTSVVALMNSWLLSFVLCLSSDDIKSIDRYSSIDEGDVSATDVSFLKKFKRFSRSSMDVSCQWLRLATVIDRILLIIITLILVCTITNVLHAN